MTHARWLRRVAFVLVAGVFLAGASHAATDTDVPTADDYARGVQLLDQGQWSDALPIYRRITRHNPADAWGWLGLAWSLHYTGDYAAALPHYRKALELGALQPPRLLLEMARCETALGRRDSAIATLQRALDAGLTGLDRVAQDRRLAPIVGDARVRAMLGLLDTVGVTRASGWRHDLALLNREIRRMHAAPYSHLSSAELDHAIAALADSVEALDDDALGVGIMRLMVRLGDGHTYAEPPFLADDDAHTIPVLVGLFDDGLFVTGTDSAHVDLLWAEVLTIAGRTPAAALAAVDPVVPRDNPMRIRSVGPQHLRSPRLLRALGVGRDVTALDLVVRDRGGRRRAVTLAAGPAPTAWVRRPPEAKTELPLYARHRRDWYWFEWLPDSTLDFQYNACQDKESESVAAFARRLLERLDQPDVARLVVDLRYNGGGDLGVNGPLLEAIVQARRVNQPGRLFVIASRHTFSAAMSFAAQLERFTHATFVGEPTGSSPNFVGETNLVVLPYSRLTVSISNLAWQNAHAKDHRIWIAPRIPAPWTFASYRAGRDPALEAIRAWR